MTLPEAIEIATKYHHDHHSFPTDIVGQAERILIEAGKRITDERELHTYPAYKLLPGETET